MLKSKVVQTVQTPLGGEFEILSGNAVTGCASVRGTGLDTPICCQIGQAEYVLRHENGKGRCFMAIYDGANQKVGTIQKLKEKGKLFQTPYYYTQIMISGKEYRGYEVAKGKEGVFYPLYLQNPDGTEAQTGLMKKDPVVYDLKDTYECYATEDLLPAQLYALFIDFWNFRRPGQVGTNTKDLECFYTTNKRLQEKYNPDFLKDM